MNQFVISRTTSNTRDFIFKGLFSGIIFYVLATYILIKYGLIGIIPLFLLVRHYAYKNIELLFDVQIFKNDELFNLTMMCFTFGLDLNRSFLVIENVAVFSGVRPTTEYGLVLVRNNGKVLKRVFKNRIKLYTGLSTNDLEKKMKEINEKFDIRYVPFFEDPNKWWW